MQGLRTRARARLLLLMAAAWLACVLPGALPMASVCARPAPSTYKVTPEVFWVNISINGRRVGFGRGQYGKGEGAAYQYQNLIIVDGADGIRQAQRFWSEFGPDLRPVNFFAKFIGWRLGASQISTVDGVFNYKTGKLSVEYDVYNTVEKVQVAIPSRAFASGAEDIVFARTRLAAGKTFTFSVYSPSLNGRRFVDRQYRVLGWDGAQAAWKIEGTSDEAPGAVSTYWFQSASPAHPNGFMVRQIMRGTDRSLRELKPVSREEAIRGFEKEAAALGI